MATDEGKVPDSGQEAQKEPPASKGAKSAPPKKGGGFPKWAIWVIVVVAIAVIAGVAVGVVLAMSGGDENRAPVISSLTASPLGVSTGGSSTVTCVASDLDGDVLQYSWSYTGGDKSGAGSTITWIAPVVAGTYTVTVAVSDGKGGTDEDSVAIVVGSTSTPTQPPTPTPTSTVAPTATATPPPSQGSIDIQSNPSGARVFIDGTDTGNITPYTITHVSEGAHVVRLVYPHYEWRTESVPVFSGETAYINWALDYSPTQSVTIQPDTAAGKDTYVYGGHPSVNKGTLNYLYVSGNASDYQCRILIQFDLSSIPSTSVILSSNLGLYYDNVYGATTSGPVGAYRVIQNWNETTVTWDNQPSAQATAIDTETIPAAATSSFIYWDIKTLVQDWVDGSVANRGVMLMDTDESSGEGFKHFRSSEYTTDTTQCPKLVIQYYDPAP